nr:anthranilate synthase alpha subunit 2, chloroplastic-like isoform X2 [Tanacetum cinerariifolium]
MFVIADELDYLITKDRMVLHDLCIVNAIDLADHFLPKLQSLNYKPMVVSFRTYFMDQIIMILKLQLMALLYTVFQPQALELCARQVSAASGDMRKALGIYRGAIEILETELRENACTLNLTLMLNEYYIDLFKSTLIPPIGIMELSCMCRVLGDHRKVTNRPLAGTIKRGKTPKEDYMLENQLLHDEIQCAKHIMLIDLRRNDVGKVGMDALRAALHVGTASSAPKVKAMELTDKLEVTRRGPYSGGFGGISFTKDMDIALALRTTVFPTTSRYDTMYSYRDLNKRRDWMAHLQAKAGIVADSDPGDEQRE